MSAFEISSLITAILSFSFGFFIFVNNRDSSSAKTWFNFSLLVSLWSLSLFGVASAQNEEIALLWQYLLDAVATLIPIFYFYFVISFLNLREKKRIAKNVSIVLGLIFFVLSFSHYIKIGVIKLAQGFYWIQPGPLYLLYVFYFSAYIVYTLILLVGVYKKSSGSYRNQIGAVIVAEIIGFGGGVTNFYLPFFNAFPIGNYLVAFYILSISYAIIRHGLFDLRVIATEIFSALLAIALLIDFLTSATLNEYLLKGILLLGSMVLSVFLIKSIFKEIRLREEIQRLADQLRKANEELKKLDQLKSEFLSLATHQLRTPLTITKGYISMVQEGTFGEVPQKIRDVLSKVYLSNERLINLVNDFLNLSRIESGRMKYNFEPMRVEALVENAVEEFKELAKEKKIDLIWKKPSGTLPEVTIDKEKFRQVLMNIIDNAFKYSKEGHIEVGMSEESRGLGDKDILIKVKDTGVGMTREELDFIFKRFARAQSGSKVNTEGTGLGLYLAKRIVNDHGGEIWAESEGHGLGSTFKIRLPAKGEEARKQARFKEFVEKI